MQRTELRVVTSPRTTYSKTPREKLEANLTPRPIRYYEEFSKTPRSYHKSNQSFRKNTVPPRFSTISPATGSDHFNRNLNSSTEASGDYIQQFKHYIYTKTTHYIGSPLLLKSIEKPTNISSLTGDTPETTNETNVTELSDEKSRNIQKVVQKVQSKMKYHKPDNTKKFSNKLSVFKDMPTFIDIRDFLPKLNISDEKQLVDSISHNFEAQVRGKSQKKKDLGNLSERELTSPQLSLPCLGKVKEIKDYLRHSNQKARMKKDKLEGSNLQSVLDRAASEFKKHVSERYSEGLNNDVTDEYQFYNNLEANLRENKYDKIDHETIDALDHNFDHDNIKFEEYLKMLLNQKNANKVTIDEAINTHQHQLKVFKDRSEKVISILKRASKNIFRRNLEVVSRKTASSGNQGLSSLQLSRSNSMLDLNSQQPKKNTKPEELIEIAEEVEGQVVNDGKSEPKNDGGESIFLTGMSRVETDPVHSSGLQSKVDGIITRVARISTNKKAINDYGRSFQYLSKDILRKTKSSDYETNKHISSLFTKCADLIVKEAENEKDLVRGYKEGLIKIMDSMNNVYQKDLEVINPKPVVDPSTLDFNFDNKEHFASFLNKPLKNKKKNGRFLCL